MLFVTAWNYFRKERKINLGGDIREQVAIVIQLLNRWRERPLVTPGPYTAREALDNFEHVHLLFRESGLPSITF